MDQILFGIPPKRRTSTTPKVEPAVKFVSIPVLTLEARPEKGSKKYRTMNLNAVAQAVLGLNPDSRDICVGFWYNVPNIPEGIYLCLAPEGANEKFKLDVGNNGNFFRADYYEAIRSYLELDLDAEVHLTFSEESLPINGANCFKVVVLTPEEYEANVNLDWVTQNTEQTSTEETSTEESSAEEITVAEEAPVVEDDSFDEKADALEATQDEIVEEVDEIVSDVTSGFGNEKAKDVIW